MGTQICELADHWNIPLTAGVVLGAVPVLACLLYMFKEWSLPLPPLPPSPPADVISGHAKLLQIPHSCRVFADLGKQLGDIIYVSVFGRPSIFLNNVEDVRELLAKRGAIYSSRPRAVLMAEMHGAGAMLFLTPYGGKFRALRRMFIQGFNSQASRGFHELQKNQSIFCLKKILETPENFRGCIFDFSSATILKAIFGYDLGSENDKFTAEATKAVESMFSIGVPGRAMVDYLPLLRYLPEWLPGMAFKRKANAERYLVENMYNIPYNDIMKRRAAGEAVPCLVNKLIDDMEAEKLTSPQHEANIKATAAVAYLGAVETTGAVIMGLVMMMVLHPEAQHRAQAEIDSVVGTHRLPVLNDRRNLPFIDCIIKETTRVGPPLEINTPHVSIKDDVYRGMRIPKGTAVMANIWNMLRDPKIYPEPESFNPERFMEKVKNTESFERALSGFDPEDPATLIFGFGRRICPGRFFADTNAWLMIAGILATFDIKPKIDPVTGKPKLPKAEFTDGFTSHPCPFEFEIAPRSVQSEKLIRDVH